MGVGMSEHLRDRIEHYWQIGNGIDQAIRNLAMRDGVRLSFQDVHPVYVRMSAQAAPRP